MRPPPSSIRRSHARGAVLWVLLACLSLIGCADTSPTLLLTVEDPHALGPTQLRISLAAPGDEALSITRPETAGAPLASGQTLRVLLPDAAVGGVISVAVEALNQGAVRGRAQGSFTPTTVGELDARLVLSPIAPDCTPESCPDGCCQDGVCQASSVLACGPAGGSCTTCDPVSADTCAEGACRCGAEAACPAAHTCTEGRCISDLQVACSQGADCAGLPSPGQCFQPSADCIAGVCTFQPQVANTACDDGNGCNGPDACNGTGACVGSPVLCASPPSGQCFEGVQGTCVSGACQYEPKTGSPCGDACLSNGVCGADGACQGTPVTCNQPPNSACYFELGLCDPVHGCIYSPQSDGTPCAADRLACTDDSCQDGVCVRGPNPCPAGTRCCEQGSDYTCQANSLASLIPACLIEAEP